MPFGGTTLAAANSVNSPFRLPGQTFDDETGLHYNYYRYYDPNTGRYLRPDPIGLQGGVNLYQYAGSNPVNMIDIWGLDTWAGLVIQETFSYMLEVYQRQRLRFIIWIRRKKIVT